MIKNKTATAIATTLILTIAITIIALPTANAHSPPWNIDTYAFIKPTPNPVGVGQSVNVVMWLLFAPPTATGGDAGDRWTNLKVTVTKPDGTSSVLGTFTSDPTGSTYTLFQPTEVGSYTFKLEFPGQVLSRNNPVTGRPGGSSAYINDTFLPSSATATLTVQAEPVRGPANYPTPTEYWTRPIEGQNTNWWTVSSNWLGSPQVIDRVVQPDGAAPNSAHVMWTKPVTEGGVVGGSREGVEGNTFYSGMTYETKFNTPIIMNGRLYYELPRGTLGTGGGYLCVDLRTGEELFWQNMTRPSFGQLLDYESPNQHGVLGSGYLYRSSGTTLLAYDPLNGNWLFNLTSVPSGTACYTDTGEVVRYVLNYNARYLALWNMSAISSLGTGLNFAPIGKETNASIAYSWNVTIPSLPGASSPAIVKILGDDMILGRSTSFAGMMADGTPLDKKFTMWALSLKPESRGQLMWIQNYSAPPGQITLRLGPVDPINRVFTVCSQEEMKVYGYSLDTGNAVWVSDPMLDPMDVYNRMGATEAACSYGNMYTGHYGGIVYAWSMKDGKLIWTYGNGGVPGNDTKSGYTSAWGSYPFALAAVADGKTYWYTTEHSPNSPLYKGALIRCLDAYTGKEIWTLSGWGSGEQGKGADFAVADGYLVYMNAYDMQIYCVGKGPSALTVEAPMTSNELGESLVIRGTVTDIAAGTEQNEQAARFPNGVPAMSDDSMGAWMEYVYMQKPKPTDAIGVPIKIEVIDSNNNRRTVGTATSDTSGMFTLSWQPDIEGNYKVIATFEGSGSYWPSFAETSFVVDPAPHEAAQPEPEPQSMTDTYVLGIGVAIIAAIAVVGAVIVLLLKKR
jgi:outer membrane protein assembly factor BamB